MKKSGCESDRGEMWVGHYGGQYFWCRGWWPWLRGAGFEEDRGASACKECCGTYKYQHDTAGPNPKSQTLNPNTLRP